MGPRNSAPAPESPWPTPPRQPRMDSAMPSATDILFRDARAWATQTEQRRWEPAFRNVTIVTPEPSARWLLSAAASELTPDPVAWCDIEDVGSSERARAHEIARRAEECDTDVVVVTADEARLAARRLVARGIAVLAVPPGWRPVAGLTRIAIEYDGSAPAEAALEATRALVVA